ncbi:MAG: outer membrane beta-barrel protein [Chitinophagaceae bacterium]|nr:outer membrane beta-barrel protein [Chitinophagaceae bacterium]
MGQSDPLRVHGSTGLATYFGDLKEKAKLIDQSSPFFNLGLSYNITDQILGRFDFSIMTLKADDRFNTRSDLVARNLNFKTTLWETNFTIQYDFLNMNSEDYFLSPYVFAGFGLMHMNPWTYDRNGVKRFLRGYHTEGQGLPSYPERKEYNLFNFQIPFGAGIKYAINENVNVYVELAFRKLFTDYLDDVGNTYPDKNIILNESLDPTTTIGLTFRGDELDPSLPYPNTVIQRGGYTKDTFYTIGIGVSFRLNGVSLGSGRSGGSFNKIRKVGSTRSRLKNPGSVF